MVTNDPRPNPVAMLRAAAVDLPENRPEALAAVASLFPELHIEGAIGRGGSGVVYRVRQASGEFAALKLLDPALSAREPAFAERLQREGRAMTALDHPGILKVRDFGDRSGRFFLLTEFIEGVDLRRLMTLGELTPTESLRLLPQICAALQYAHDKGIVHRDVKPENVLVDLDGQVKIADFGLARIVGRDGPDTLRLTRESQRVGTPHYMAPEQWRGALVDHRADVFALGVMLYELLTGQLPVGDFPPPSSRPGVPRGLDEVVRRALAQEPERRYQRVDELGRAAARAAARENDRVSPKAAPIGSPLSRSRRRWSWRPIAGAALLLLLAIGGYCQSLPPTRPNGGAGDGRALSVIVDHSPAGRGVVITWLAFSAALVLVGFSVRGGFRRIDAIQRAGAGARGLGSAEFLAWGPFVLAFDVAVLLPLWRTGLPYEEAIFACALILLGILNVLFLAWRHRNDRAAATVAHTERSRPS